MLGYVIHKIMFAQNTHLEQLTQLLLLSCFCMQRYLDEILIASSSFISNFFRAIHGIYYPHEIDRGLVFYQFLYLA